MKNCVICGAELTGKYSNNRKYCSQQCARKAEAEKRINNIADRASRINKVAHAVYRAYSCKCAVCGWQATPELISFKGRLQYAHGNEVHHINPVAEGGTEDGANIILLCPNHHKQADLGILSREELQKYTRPLDLTEDAISRMKAECTDAIASLIFDS